METTQAEPTFHTLAEEFLRRRRSLSSYSVEVFADEFPHMREVILREFPAIILAESLKKPEITVAVPDKLGRYQVGKELGRGAMGIVVSATNPDLNSEVAIKLLSFQRIHSIEMLQRFHAEARTCAAMDHPNIVPVFDYGTDEKFAFLVMRRVRGKSLDKVIAGLAKKSAQNAAPPMQLDWGFIATIGSQAADALQYAHEQGIIHRDIKPANLILEKEGKIWVSDFGLSKVLNSNSSISTAGDVIGTPRYMAPEQLRGVCDARSDVYSLGMTLYELASGRTICESLNTTQLLPKKNSLELPNLKTVNPSIPSALSQIIMRAIELRPEDRFASAEEMSVALKRIVHETSIGDRRLNSRATERRSKYLTAAFAVCAGLVAAACVYLLNSSEDERLVSALQQPDTVGKILNQEESRQIIAEQLPDLIHTATKADRETLRTAIAALADEVVTASVAKSDASEEEKALFLNNFNRMRDAFEELGLHAPPLEPMQEEELAQAHWCDRMRLEIAESAISTHDREHAERQISRYEFAVANELFPPARQLRTLRVLRSLPTIESQSSDSAKLTNDGLRMFIGFLQLELDRASVPQKPATIEEMPLPVRVPPPGHRESGKSDSANLLDQYENDPRFSDLLKQAESDPRFSDLLNQIKSAGGQ